MNDRTWRAEQAEREAKQKLDNANSLIQSAVDKNTKAIEEENAQKLQEAKKKTIAVNSSIAPAIALYAVILTLIWAVGKREIVSTFPEWFVRRWENIKTVAEALKTAFMWVHDTLPETWYEAIRYIIPTLMSGVILFGLYIALRSLLKRYTEWNKDIWDKYRREDEEKRLKAFYHVVICLVSFLVSILLAEATPLLWFSWYLILSIGGNLAYHKLCENHQSSYSHYW